MSEPTATEAAPKKSSKKKLIVAALGTLLLAGGAAGGTWFMMKGKAAPDAAHEAAAAPKKEEKKPIFAALDPFTVNLQDGRGERYAQIGVTLQLDDPVVETAIKEKLPAVRSQILLLIASKTIDDLLTPEGKARLATQIGVRAAQAIGTDITDADVLPAIAAAPVAPAAPAAAAAPAHDGVPAAAAAAAPAAAPVQIAAAKPRKAAENPVRQVLFSNFIVQ